MPNIAGYFWLPSLNTNEDLKVRLEILGFLDVNPQLKHVKRTLHDLEIWFFLRQFISRKPAFSVV